MLFNIQWPLFHVYWRKNGQNQGKDILLTWLGRYKINSHLFREQCIFLFEIYINYHECAKFVVRYSRYMATTYIVSVFCDCDIVFFSILQHTLITTVRPNLVSLSCFILRWTISTVVKPTTRDLCCPITTVTKYYNDGFTRVVSALTENLYKRLQTGFTEPTEVVYFIIVLRVPWSHRMQKKVFFMSVLSTACMNLFPN